LASHAVIWGNEEYKAKGLWQNCSGAFRVSSLQDSRVKTKKRNPDCAPLTQKVGTMGILEAKSKTNHVGRLCWTQALQAVQREQLWIAPALLAAVQPSPWLRPATSKPSRKTDRTAPKNQTNEFK
jgi:hypothetical protein